MTTFKPTHKITTLNDETLVSLIDDCGPAYTEQEWLACDQADYERNSDGIWTFQGGPFSGTVEKI